MGWVWVRNERSAEKSVKRRGSLLQGGVAIPEGRRLV